jgi:hypothetical protein
MEKKSSPSVNPLRTIRNLKSSLPKPERPSLPLLTSALEKSQNFYSESGRQLNKSKQLQRDQRLYLTSDSGICLVPSPITSPLPPSSAIPITLTLYNDVCGEFEPQTFPVKIRIRGSPIRLAPNQVGITPEIEKGSGGYIGLGELVRAGGRFSKKFVLENTGPKDIAIEWNAFELGKGFEKKNYFKLEIGEGKEGWGIRWKPEEPEKKQEEEAVGIEPRFLIII